MRGGTEHRAGERNKQNKNNEQYSERGFVRERTTAKQMIPVSSSHSGDNRKYQESHFNNFKLNNTAVISDRGANSLTDQQAEAQQAIQTFCEPTMGKSW